MTVHYGRLATCAITATMIVLGACSSQPSFPSATWQLEHFASGDGFGEVPATPDTMIVTAAIDTTAPTAAAAVTQARQRRDTLTDNLTRAGTPRADIGFAELSLPTADAVSPPPAPDEFTVTTTLTVTIRHLDHAPEVLTLLDTTKGGTGRIATITYAIADPSTILDQARQRAYENARELAQQQADAVGKTLGDLASTVMMRENVASPGGQDEAAPDTASGELALRPGQHTVGVAMTVTWVLKP